MFAKVTGSSVRYLGIAAIVTALAITAIAGVRQPATTARAHEKIEIPPVLLTIHENVTFENQTIYISGQAFIDCTFRQCTLVLREKTFHLDRCTFDRCNWHIDLLLGWADPSMRRDLRGLLDMLDAAEEERE